MPYPHWIPAGDDYGFTASEAAPLLQVEEDLGERFNRAAEYPERAEKLVENLRAYRQQILREGTIGIERSALCGMIRSMSKDDLNTLGREVLQQGRGGLGVCDDGIDLSEITEE